MTQSMTTRRSASESRLHMHAVLCLCAFMAHSHVLHICILMQAQAIIDQSAFQQRKAKAEDYAAQSECVRDAVSVVCLSHRIACVSL